MTETSDAINGDLPHQSEQIHHYHHHRTIDEIDLDDPEYIKTKQRPATVKEDVKRMEARKRVSEILQSRHFKHELEELIFGQIKAGIHSPSLIALQHVSDLLFPNLFQKGLQIKGKICPINDIKSGDPHYSKMEKILRCKLASLYRLVEMMEWTQGIYNHISVRISQQEEMFLLNPFGLLYSEVTASSLNKVNMQGDIVEQGSTNFGISKAGFVIHGAIHGARPDLKCIIHLHLPEIVAVSCFKSGLLPMSQEALICGEISYFDYDGIVNDEESMDKLVRSLGPKNKVFLLRNHGILACGSTIEEAFHFAYHAVLACRTQTKAIAMTGGNLDNLVLVGKEIAVKTFQTANRPDLGVDSQNQNSSSYKYGLGELFFEGYMRMLDEMGYKTGYPYKNYDYRQERSKKIYDEVEYPPASISRDEDWEERLPMKYAEYKKRVEKKQWLNSPNTYMRVEVMEEGTRDPKKFTKWVLEENESKSTVQKVDETKQFIPIGTTKTEFKEVQKAIKANRRGEKMTPGPQSQIINNISLNEASKLQDSEISDVGDQIIIVGSASRGIIEKNQKFSRQYSRYTNDAESGNNYVHNVCKPYHQEYRKNPFDHVDCADIDEYNKKYTVPSQNSEDASKTTLANDNINNSNIMSSANNTYAQFAENMHNKVWDEASKECYNTATVIDETSNSLDYDKSGTLKSTDSGEDATTEEKSPVNSSKEMSSPTKEKKKKGFRTPSFLKRSKKKEKHGASAHHQADTTSNASAATLNANDTSITSSKDTAV